MRPPSSFNRTIQRATNRMAVCCSCLVLYFGAVLPAAAQQALSKSQDTIYPVSQGIHLELDNRYGRVTLVLWERNEIEVQTEIVVRDTDPGKARETLEGISVQQLRYGNFLRLESMFDEQSSGFKRTLQSINPFERSGIDVNYRISLPAYVTCDIDNQFGDIYLPALTRHMQISLRYGDLRAESLGPDSRLQLDYGKAVIGKADGLFAKLNNAELDLSEASRLELESATSILHLGRIGELTIQSRKDEIRIRTAKRIQANGRFSTLQVDELIQRAELDWYFGRMELSRLEPGFATVRIQQRNAEVRIHIAELSFFLDAYLEGGQLVVPNDISDLNVQVLDEKNKVRRLSGTMKRGKPDSLPASRFDLEGKNGEIVLYR